MTDGEAENDRDPGELRRPRAEQHEQREGHQRGEDRAGYVDGPAAEPVRQCAECRDGEALNKSCDQHAVQYVLPLHAERLRRIGQHEGRVDVISTSEPSGFADWLSDALSPSLNTPALAGDS